MSGLEIRPFEDGDVEAAAALLRRRHARHRRALPLLADVDDLAARIDDERRAAEVTALVAERNGDVVAYLIAATHPRLRTLHVGSAGHAAADAEVVRDLYAAVADSRVAAGQTRHTVNVPATDEGLLAAWFRLCFGQQQAYAVRAVAPHPAVEAPATIRLGGESDLELVVALDRLLPEHQALAPTFAGVTPPSTAEAREDWEQTLAELSVALFVAEERSEPVGCLLLTNVERDFVEPRHNVDLSFAVTVPRVRGSGVGRALAAHAFTWAHQRGYRTITADWRVPNLLSSRFWERRGFRPAFLRLYRSIP